MPVDAGAPYGDKKIIFPYAPRVELYAIDGQIIAALLGKDLYVS